MDPQRSFLPLKYLIMALAVAAASALLPVAAMADADEAPTANSTTLGLQPIRGPIPAATPAPGESRVFRRPDGAYQAIPDVRGRVKTFHIVERAAPWTLKPGMTVMANTYNGVVPGPAIVVNQGDTVVLEYENDDRTPDTIHLHGIHDIPVSMDGVGGISQPLVPAGGRYTYRFVADSPGTFIYHSHDDEAMLNSGLYGAVIVEPAHPRPVETGLAHDFLQVISSWQIQSAAENEFTLNGKEFPATTALDVKRGERFRIRWINISGENFHTMHTHGHYQQIVDARRGPGPGARRRRHRTARPRTADRRRREGGRAARHVADSLPRPRPYRRFARHARRTHQRDPLRWNAQYAHLDVPGHDAGRQCVRTQTAEFRDDRGARSDRRVHDLSGIADRPRAPRVGVRRWRCSMRSRLESCSISCRDRAERDPADRPRRQRLARRRVAVSGVARAGVRRRSARRTRRPRQHGYPSDAQRSPTRRKSRCCFRRSWRSASARTTSAKGLPSARRRPPAQRRSLWR